MAVIDSGSNNAGKANVDSNYNLCVVTPTDEDLAGFSVLSGQLDDGASTGTREIQAIRVSPQGRLIASQDAPLLYETFNGTALNTSIFTSPVTTFATAVTGGFCVLNSGNVTTANAVARIATYPFFSKPVDAALFFESDIILTQAPQTNNVVEIGMFQATGTTAPTDGILFRYDATGVLKAVIVNNSTEITSGALTAPSAGVRHSYRAVIDDDAVRFSIDGVIVAKIPVPSATAAVCLSESQPFTVREYNAAVAPTVSQQTKVGNVYVGLRDNSGASFPIHHAQSLMGRHSYQGQTGHTLGSTANYANSANPTAAVPTNTTAALGSGLGGQFWATATLALNTDGIISSYQNPAGTAAISGKVLMITGVSIDTYVQTTLTGGGFNIQWSLAFGHNAVSLATTTSATAKAPVRVPLGVQTLAATAPALTTCSTVAKTFQNPIPVYPGEFVQTVCKYIGTVATAGVLGHVVTFDGYFI